MLSRWVSDQYELSLLRLLLRGQMMRFNRNNALFLLLRVELQRSVLKLLFVGLRGDPWQLHRRRLVAFRRSPGHHEVIILLVLLFDRSELLPPHNLLLFAGLRRRSSR